MGTWRIEPGLYGEQERWIPDFAGEWPDVPEPPCAVCHGELIRRTAYAGILFERRCYRGPHGIARQGSPERGGTVLIGSLPTLQRPERTRDWGAE